MSARVSMPSVRTLVQTKTASIQFSRIGGVFVVEHITTVRG